MIVTELLRQPVDYQFEVSYFFLLLLLNELSTHKPAIHGLSLGGFDLSNHAKARASVVSCSQHSNLVVEGF